MEPQPAYDLDFLLQALSSAHERVASWGAYQLVLKGGLDSEIKFFLESPFSAIQEAGMAYMAETGNETFLSEAIGIFRESEGQLKYSAAFCLACFPNDFSKNLLFKWFDQVTQSEHSTRLELEAATYSLLQVDPQAGFDKVFARLRDSGKNIIQASILWQHLLPCIKTQPELDGCMEQYFFLRETYSDTDLTYHLVEQFSHLEVLSWVEKSLDAGYSLKSIYEQCYRLLRKEITPEQRELWQQMQTQALGAKPLGTPVDAVRLLDLLEKWSMRLVKGEQGHTALIRHLWLMQAFQRHGTSFHSTIPKIMQTELLLLLSLPLVMLLESRFRQWLERPQDAFSTIANYYHSPLLSAEHCQRLLQLFFPHPPPATPEQYRIKKPLDDFRPNMSRPEILWALFRGDLGGYDVDWPKHFPNPYAQANLPPLLLEFYLANFEHYLAKRDLVAVDYALQLFQRFSDPRIRELCHRHFDDLINHHGEMFSQLLETHPDVDLIPRMRERFLEGEQDLAPLIEFTCRLFKRPLPPEVAKHLEQVPRPSDGPKKSLRLFCPNCKKTFPYHAEEIVLDMGALQRGNLLTNQSLWVEKQFHCKKCSQLLPLELDDLQLAELAQQSRIESMLNLKLGSHAQPLGHRLVLLDFPRLQGIAYNPRDFAALVAQAEAQSQDRESLSRLQMQLAKLYYGMGRWTKLIQLLRDFEPFPTQAADMNFYLGQAYLKIGRFAEARPCFEFLVKTYENLGDSHEFPYLEKARYWLKTLDTYSVKRARFQVIEGRK